MRYNIDIRLPSDYVCHRDSPTVIIEGYKDFFYKSSSRGCHELDSFHYKEGSEPYNELMKFCDKLAEEVREMVKKELI